MIFSFDVWGLHHFDGARVNHDQFRTLTDATFNLRADYRMAGSRVAAHDEDDIGFFDRFESLCAG